jgi:acetyl esterase/lipase
MWQYYLDGADGAVSDPSYASPAHASRLDGLPPTYILTCEYDPLRDEGLAYATKLLAAGISTEVHNAAGTFHGFDLLPTESGRLALDEQVAFIRRHLSR